ncbi:2592_t:CDS:1 [Acaulospora colombiana]|uniref:2592_t:CDS:1 n=1 Tax=Acaulospora colombiana TaxID=27376 RepID=A0ACA9K0N8_9GLOM|nr:2592_t:CDS:1 [Acaulospora colombiana]
MPFYSQWYKQSVCLRGNDNSIDYVGENTKNASTDAVQADLTPIQVTVSSVKDKLVYNVEYKPSEGETNLDKIIHSRESTASSTKLKTSSPHVGAAANAVVARFVQQNHSRTHSRQGSSVSDTIFSSTDRVSSDSMWEDWIVKYLHEDTDAAAEEAPMEDWVSYKTTDFLEI